MPTDDHRAEKKILRDIFGDERRGKSHYDGLHLGYETYLRHAISRHQDWICAVLECPPEEVVAIKLEIALEEAGLRAAVDNPRLAPGLFPAGDFRIQNFAIVTSMRTDVDTIIGRDCTRVDSRASWADPILHHASGTPFIYLNLRYADGPDADLDFMAPVVLCSRRGHPAVFDWLLACERQRINKIKDNFIPTLRTFDSEQHHRSRAIALTDWQALTSSQSALTLRADIEAFCDNYRWYRENRLSYRRGYLLYGPPGNGKTTCVKIMATQYKMNVFTANFGMKTVNDSTLGAVYDAARSDMPAIILLEDIDRIFGRGNTASHTTNVTFQHLLNCLDGVDTPDGLVVVATANHPDDLDISITKRPGRFHRIIGFDNPTGTERDAYFLSRVEGLGTAESGQLAEATERFSYAQLNEVYTLASFGRLHQRHDQKPALTAADLLAAVGLIRDSYQDLKDRRSDKAGFNGR